MKEKSIPSVDREEYSRREFFEALFGPEQQLPRSRPILRVKTDMPYVCIGLDDGWDPEKVEEFLQIADDFKSTTFPDYKTKFTIFPVGKVMVKDAQLWRGVKEEGHEIGNHSHDHIYIRNLTKGRIKRSFRIFEDEDYPEVFDEAFPDPGLARVPFAEGPINTLVQEALYELNDLQVHWLRDSYSWARDGIDSPKNQKYALDKIGNLAQGEIGVMHFTQLDMAVLPILLQMLDERGLINVPFSVLWEARKNK